MFDLNLKKNDNSCSVVKSQLWFLVFDLIKKNINNVVEFCKKHDQGFTLAFTYLVSASQSFSQLTGISHAMRSLLVISCVALVIFFLFPAAISSSFTIINSIGQECCDGECTDICEFEDFKLKPGTGTMKLTVNFYFQCQLAFFCS
jgi:hypothetical protein